MADLTEQNISEIKLLVEARGVEMKELSYDLVDHICCMIEEKMESGKNYTSALEESIASFGKKGIQQIQEETTFLLTKNILAMRKTMHITGITSAILLLLATIFKIKHLPGTGIMYVVGAALLCFIFMPLFLTVRIKEKVGKLNVWSNVLGMLSAIALCLGILFKIMHWPWANVLMSSGGAVLLIIFLPFYIYNGYKQNQLKTSTIVPVIIAVAGFSLMFSLVRLQSSSSVRTARTNFHNNINQNIVGTVELNKQLAKKLEKNSNDLASINSLANEISKMSNELILKFIQSKLDKYTAEEIRHKEQTDFENYSITMGMLSSIRSEKNGLSQLLLLVENYKAEYAKITGEQANLIINDNFNYYLDRQNEMFAFRFVLRDINSLNLQIQTLHTGVLQYYKGKVS